MAEQLAKVYEPDILQAQAEQIWSAGDYFHAKADGDGGRSYTIVIPPPNVTAALHLGHALNNTLQDILIRFRRMQQYNTLWMPGTDHAGIATQTVVEKRLLSEQGKRRTDFGRDEFIGHVRSWKDEYESQIINQLKKMGCSCDWERTRFTMDEVCAKAVRTNFFNLFKDGLIYRGKRIVNWDPVTQTVLADDEVEHETVAGHFWYMRYPLAEAVEIDGKMIECVTVATTRPETMLGDTAVAMNPSDKRAKILVGKKVRLPIVGRLIPIIADEHVVLPNPDSDDEKAKFSTGFLKVTPAHDPDDWAIGQRHNLDIINVMAPDGSISDKFGWEDAGQPEAQNLLGMDRFEAREAIVEFFRTEKLLEDIREHTHEVGHSYRSHVPIEPYLSDQWYIAVKKPIDRLAEKFGAGYIEGTDVPANSLAGLALKPLLDGKMKFVPQRYAKTYQIWLENLRDWPISRQLWWGHRIPIWYKVNFSGELTQDIISFVKAISNRNDIWVIARYADDEQKISVSELQSDIEGVVSIFICMVKDDKDIISKLNNLGFQQDEDVLDTWFSSALWPFSTMGWPDATDEMKTFYPGNVLCTAREIITLWVSRMVMMGQYCVGDIPFTDVYIHAMIQDGQGRKMSKSFGNGIDPLVAIDSHGADAMRFTLANMTTNTQDIRMPVAAIKLADGRTVNSSAKFDGGRNFCNKLWNASRFAMMNLEAIDAEKFDAGKMDTADKWILSQTARTIGEVTKGLDDFKYNEPLSAIYRFFWNDFCDWYLEWAKPRMQDDAQKPIAQSVLAFVLDRLLRLLHPFVPFITEAIFQKLNEIAPVRKLKGIADAEPADALIIARWPGNIDSLIDEDAEKQILAVQDVARSIRDIKTKYNKANTKTPSVSIICGELIAGILNANSDLICQAAGVEKLLIGADIEKPENAASAIIDDIQIYIPDMIDKEAEQSRLWKQKQQVENGIKGLLAKLNNENFVTRAKPEVVTQAKVKLQEAEAQAEAIDKLLQELDS